MDNKKIIEVINDIEQKFNVNEVQYKSIKVWPLLRLLIVQELSGNNNQKVENKNSFSDHIRSTALAIKTIFFYLIKIIRSSSICEIHDCVDIYLISRSSDRTECINGKFFNRITDSLFFYIKDTFTVRIIEYTNIGKRQKPTFYENCNIDDMITIAYNKIMLFNQLPLCIKFSKNDKNILELISDYLERKYGLYVNWSDRLSRYVRTLLVYKKVFKKFFNKNKPKCIITVCFYDLVSMAMILACNELNIKTAEFQHGQQGDYHIMYSHWNNFPMEGYEILPEIFFVWGNKSFNRINSWCEKSIRHKVIIGGNPWVSMWKNETLFMDVYKSYDLSIFNNKYKKILLSLQPLNDPIPNNIISVIRATSGKVKWYIRLHPRMSNLHSNVCKFLSDNGCDNYELDYSTQLPLYLILKFVDLHITLWSSVAYEALAFGVHSLIVHVNGYNQMKEYCDKKIFYYSEDSTEITNVINTDFEFKPEVDEYINSDSSIIIQSLNKILTY
jgi:hypothetical protein